MSLSILQVGPLSLATEALLFSASRASGPGGQNVNKLNTRVEVRLAISAIEGMTEPIDQRLRMLAGKRLTAGGELRIVCQQTRSQEANRETALALLLKLLTDATRLPKKRYATKPSRASRRRRLVAKKRRGVVKQDRRGPADE